MQDEEIQSFMNLIEQHAWVAWTKLRKPATLDVEDLIQEGVHTLLEVKERWYSPEKGASLKTLFTLALRQKYCTIVTTSYAPNKQFHTSEQKEKYANNYKKKHTLEDPADIAHVTMLLQDLTEQERMYIVNLLSTNSRSRRREAREALNLTKSDEEQIRSSIISKVLNNFKEI